MNEVPIYGKYWLELYGEPLPTDPEDEELLQIRNLDRLVAAAEARGRKQAADDIAELVEAIRLTQEYAQLPAVPGWSWYDVLAKHAPDVLAVLIRYAAEQDTQP